MGYSDIKLKCAKCKIEKGYQQFYKRSEKRPKKYRSYCKKCMSRDQKEWYYSYREKAAATSKEWRQNNREKSVADSREWRSNNKERKVACNNRYKCTVRGKLSSLLNGAHDRSRKRNLDFDISLNFLEKMWNDQKGICALSGNQMKSPTVAGGRSPISISIDRIDPKKGYIKGNVRLVCHKANFMKGTESDLELIEWCKMVIENNPQLQ